MLRIESLDGRPLEPGVRFLVLQPKLPATRWLVTECTPGRSFTWRSQRPGIAVEAVHVVTARPGGALVTLELRFSGLIAPLVGRLARPLCERYLRLEATELKRRCEERLTSATSMPARGRSGARDGADPPRRPPSSAPRSADASSQR